MFNSLLGILTRYETTTKLTLLFGRQHPATRRHIPEERRPQLHHCSSPDTSRSAIVHCTKVSEHCEEGDCLYRLTLKINLVRFFETSRHSVASQNCGVFYVESFPHKVCGLTL